MTVRFRNVDVDPTADPDDWPFEAILTMVERGMLSDWQLLTAAIRSNPWGGCARAVEQIASWDEHYGADRLFAHVVAQARQAVDAESRRSFGERMRAVRLALGMSLRDFAPLIGTSAQRLSSYESGQVAPTVNILGRIERVDLRG